MYRTADFAELYQAVTRHIASAMVYVQSHYSTYNLPVEWLTYLTRAFEQQFGDWPDDGRLGAYLDGLESWQGKSVHPAIRLAGHVYLHIGYDLPRSIAVTLGADRGAMHVPGGSATLMSPAPVAVAHADRAAARMLFLQATPAFEAALLSHDGHKVLRRAGFPMMWLRIFGAKRQQAVLEAMSQWAIALRGIAWMHAETLADVPESMQQHHVERLLVTMQEAQDAITQRTRLMDIRVFQAPRLLQIAPVTLLVGDTVVTVVSIFLVIVAAVAVIAFTSRGRRERIAAAIDALGRETYRRLADRELLSPDSGASSRPLKT